ncbi:MAG: lipopolysaccharide biosynthesis protein [Planctomyces sp.]|nr:lipopolysaccharide biosynthesis protein [Planctomyces sp.]
MSTTAVRNISLFSDAFGTLAVRILGIGLVFITTAVLAPMLGPHEYGTYSAGLSLAVVLSSLVPLGTDRVLTRNLATVHCPEDAGAETAVAHISSLLTSLLVFVLGSLQFWFSDWLPLSVAWYESCMIAAILFVPVTLTNLRQWIAIPLIGTRHAVLPEQTILPILFLLSAGFAYALKLPFTATSAALSFAGLSLVVWLVSLSNPSIQIAYRTAIRHRPSAREVTCAIQTALPFVNVSFGGILLQRCIPLITAETCGFQETGQFAVAQQFAGLPAIPLGVATLVILPRCTRHFRMNETEEATRTIRDSATTTFLLAVLVAAIVWVSRPLMPLIFGGSFSRVEEVLPILLLATIAEAVSGPSMAVMQAMRIEHTLARCLIGFIPVQLGLVYLFSQWFGLEGAALGLLVSRLLWIGLVVRIIYASSRILSVPSLRFPKFGLNSFRSRHHSSNP